jgi:hypothetical protein
VARIGTKVCSRSLPKKSTPKYPPLPNQLCIAFQSAREGDFKKRKENIAEDNAVDGRHSAGWAEASSVSFTALLESD